MKCECGTEYEGNFCPNCGRKNVEQKKQGMRDSSRERPRKAAVNASAKPIKTKNKKGKKKIALIISVAVVLLVLITSGKKRDNVQMDNADIKSQLSDEVTADYLPGTYESDDGKIFAISIEDESILDINVTLANIFRGKDWSSCQVVLSDLGWTDEIGLIDIGDKTITVSGEPDTVFKYEIDKEKLVLIDSNGDKVTYTKISDEYNVDVLTEGVLPVVDDVIGNYVHSAGGSDDILIVEKMDDSSVNVYLLYAYYESGNPVYKVRGLVEKVPTEKFNGNDYVCLKGEDNTDTYYIKFVSRDTIYVENRANCIREETTDYNIVDEINKYKAEHPEMDYQYASFTDVEILFTSPDGAAYSFNREWYKKYAGFMSESGIILKVNALDNKTVQILADGKEYCTFQEDGYIAGKNTSYVVYQCDDGKEFEYYPEYSSNIDGNIPLIRFNTFDAESMGYDVNTEYGLDFPYSEFALSDNDQSVLESNPVGDGQNVETDDLQEDINLQEDIGSEEVSIDDKQWFLEYDSFYHVRVGDQLSISAMNDALLFVSFTGINGDYMEWEFSLEPDAVNQNGSLGYFGDDICMTYYPEDHHIDIVTNDSTDLYYGEYWPN